MTISAAAAIQRRHWGTDPEAWADLSEPHNRPLFEAVLDAAALGPSKRLLDIGCGTGMLLQLALARGGVPCGIDVTPELLAIARERLPEADLREGDMESLPWADDSFDVVTGVNAFQFAGDPGQALSEAARVLRPGGHLVASLFAAPERSEGTAVHEAMAALSPPAKESEHAPYLLSAPGRLEQELESRGLPILDSGEVACVWAYASIDDAVRAMVGSGGGARAVSDVGSDAVREAITPVLWRFRDPLDGTVSLRNTFRWVAAGGSPKQP
ncbi:MAG: class I SAM-dependent methyltransferase [Verrucomicrobia bacterium]|nr:class I SAM-dependent methyltransferase [Verrucomicrobiota bacterium]